MIHNDHVQVGAVDAKSSARFLAEVLGVGEPIAEGRDGDMFRLDFDNGEFLLVSPAKEPVPFAHVAYRVDQCRFDEIVARLRARGVRFGNHHEDTTNGKSVEPLGGEGRVYFSDANGHLWEVVC